MMTTTTTTRSPGRRALGFGFGPGMIGVMAVTAILGSCSAPADDRGPVLRAVADLGVAASDDFAREAEALRGGVEALCAGPSVTTLEAAQGRWSAAYDAWAFTAALALGPEMEHEVAVDFWPARTDTIEGQIAAAPAAVDDAYIDGLGASAKGLPALEYMLFGEGDAGGDPQAALAALGDPGAGAARCAYALALARDLEGRAAAIADAWSGEFADVLAQAGEGSPRFADRKAAIDAIVNQSIDALASAVKVELDKPLGNETGAPPDPTLLRSRFRGGMAGALEAELRGVWAVYHGADEAAAATGVSTLVVALDPDLDARVREQYGYTVDAVLALPAPPGPALTDQRDAFQAARDEIDALRRLLKLDVASRLGVTLSLSDNDGD